MFDASTAVLIQTAPEIPGVDPQTLPQDLTRAYAELVALRLRAGEPDAEAARELRHDRLLKMAAVYEGLVDANSDPRDRRGAAFVAGTAYQILGRVGLADEVPADDLLTGAAVHPDVAAPLLFLIAGQSPDAREAGRRLARGRSGAVLTGAMVETISDLAAEDFEAIMARANRLGRTSPSPADGFYEQAVQTLYGLCWSGVVQLVAQLLDHPAPPSVFQVFETPEEVFRRVEDLAVETLDLPGDGGQLVSTYAGPRHLARLLRHVAGRLMGTGLANLRVPDGADPATLRRWLRHRAKSKPLIWPNHQPAIDLGILEQGRSAVLVLPTGAGKTTLSELKIAATLSRAKKVVFLVPTLALVDQLRDDLAASFPTNLGGIVVSADGDLAVLANGPELSDIEVMTPERFLALLSFADADTSEIGLIVFDECHLLSPEGGGSRSVDAMLCLLQAVKRAPKADLLLLSAMLTNGEELAAWLANLTGREATYFHDAWKPSRQARGVVIYPAADLDVIRNYVIQRDIDPSAQAPACEATAYALFGLSQNWAPQNPADTSNVRLLESPVQLSVGAYGAAPNANTVAAAIAREAATNGIKAIVFVQRADFAPSTARKLADLPRAIGLTQAEQGYIADLIEELGGPTRSLVDPAAGALPHNGDMLPTERRLAESLFRRSDGVNIIVATPTLAQGINLPAQMAIIAGDKRHDDDGREPLKDHEILNAAGRAGRAGHLANGTVLLIPEPVVGFDPVRGPSPASFLKLRSILPANDQCVTVDDPLERLLDQIQLGQRTPEVRYFVSRIRAGEDDAQANVQASALVRRSLAAFRARKSGQEADFDAKIGALDAALAEEVADGVTDVVRIAAFSGLPVAILSAMDARLADPATYPQTVTAWVDWIVDLLRDDLPGRDSLFGANADLIRAVSRGKKTGPALTAPEFEILRAGLHAWLSGKSFEAIELALGVPPARVRTCGRARDLVLKIVNRKLYMLCAALAELAKARYAAGPVADPYPAILEVLAYAVRSGFDTPEKVALAHQVKTIRTRFGVHKVCRRQEVVVAPSPLTGFREVLTQVSVWVAFGGLDADDDE